MKKENSIVNGARKLLNLWRAWSGHGEKFKGGVSPTREAIDFRRTSGCFERHGESLMINAV